MASISRSSRSSLTAAGKGGRIAAGLVAVTLAGAFLAAPAFAADIDVQKLWTKNCQSCHGADGKAKTKAGEKSGAKDLTSAEVKAKLTRDKAIEAIKNGVKEKDSDKMAMKAYAEKLSSAEIEALADHSLAFK